VSEKQRYHHERHHQGLGNQSNPLVVAQTKGNGRMVSSDRLDALVEDDHRSGALSAGGNSRTHRQPFAIIVR
jgi:hypothetical protein